MTEWSKVLDWKSSVRATVPRVRIPPSPQNTTEIVELPRSHIGLGERDSNLRCRTGQRTVSGLHRRRVRTEPRHAHSGTKPVRPRSHAREPEVSRSAAGAAGEHRRASLCCPLTARRGETMAPVAPCRPSGGCGAPTSPRVRARGCAAARDAAEHPKGCGWGRESFCDVPLTGRSSRRNIPSFQQYGESTR